MKIITKNPQETQKIGLNIAKKLRGGEIFALSGDLGGGKTTFVKGLARGLGSKKTILSPTFVLMKPYPLKKRMKFFYHLDLYRLKKPEEVISAGLLENLGKPQTVWAIEWAEKIIKLLPNKKININFKYLNNNSRFVEIKNMPSYLKKGIRLFK